MINQWDGIVLFSESLVDLGVAWLSDFFTWFVSLPSGRSAPPTACRGRSGGQDVAALWSDWSGSEPWHFNLSWAWHPPTFALIVKWGCYPKFSRKAVVQLSWDGWKASFLLYKCHFFFTWAYSWQQACAFFLILCSLQRSFINMITFPKYLIKSCWPVDFTQFYKIGISFI